MSTSADIYFPPPPVVDPHRVSQPSEKGEIRHNRSEQEERDNFSALVEQENSDPSNRAGQAGDLPAHPERSAQERNIPATAETTVPAPSEDNALTDKSDGKNSSPQKQASAPQNQEQVSASQNKTNHAAAPPQSSTPNMATDNAGPKAGSAAGKNAANVPQNKDTSSASPAVNKADGQTTGVTETASPDTKTSSVDKPASSESANSKTAPIAHDQKPDKAPAAPSSAQVDENSAPKTETARNNGPAASPENTEQVQSTKNSVGAPQDRKAVSSVQSAPHPAEKTMVEGTNTVSQTTVPQENIDTAAKATPVPDPKAVASVAHSEKGAKATTNSAVESKKKTTGSKSTAQNRTKFSANSHVSASQDGSKAPSGLLRFGGTPLFVNMESDPALMREAPTMRLGQIGGQNGNQLLSLQDVAVNRTTSPGSLLAKAAAQTTGRPVTEQLSVAISKNITGGKNNFSIRLHPAELGQVDIRLEFAADGKMQALLTVDNERTLSLLQRDQGLLEKTLQNAGFDTSNGNLNFAMKQNGGGHHTGQDSKSHASNESLQDDLASMMPPEQVQFKYGASTLDISV